MKLWFTLLLLTVSSAYASPDDGAMTGAFRADLQMGSSASPIQQAPTGLGGDFSGLFSGPNYSQWTSQINNRTQGIVNHQNALNLQLQSAQANSSINAQYASTLTREWAAPRVESIAQVIARARISNPNQFNSSSIADTPEADLPYRFVSPEGEFKEQAVRLYQDLYKAPKTGFKRETVREIGLRSVELSDQAYSLQNEEDAQFFKQVATEMLDVAVGIDPVTGLGRSTFELLTGKNMITGATLSGVERSLAAVGVMSFGMGSTVIKGAKMATRMYHVFDGATHIIQSRTTRHSLELAMHEGQAIYTKVDHLVTTTIRESRVTKIEIAEEINRTYFKRYLEAGTPPFQLGSHVIEAKLLRETRFFRFHHQSNQYKNWVFRESQIRGLTPEQIINKFSIPGEAPTRYFLSEVHVPKDSVILRGNIEGHHGAPSGAVQYYLKEVKQEWFKTTTLLE